MKQQANNNNGNDTTDNATTPQQEEEQQTEQQVLVVEPTVSLHEACEDESLEVVKKILQEDADMCNSRRTGDAKPPKLRIRYLARVNCVNIY